MSKKVQNWQILNTPSKFDKFGHTVRYLFVLFGWTPPAAYSIKHNGSLNYDQIITVELCINWDNSSNRR